MHAGIQLKHVNIVLAITLVVLQTKFWLGEGGVKIYNELKSQTSQMEAQTNDLRTRNALLRAEVLDLKTSVYAIEERARTDLGLIRNDEVFYYYDDH